MIKFKKIIGLSIILLILLSQSTYARVYTGKSKVSSKIISISNLSYQIKQGDDYLLPNTVKVKMVNNSQANVSVKWNQKAINSSNLGTYKIYGTVKDYKNKVLLTVTVNKKNVEDIAGETKKSSTIGNL